MISKITEHGFVAKVYRTNFNLRHHLLVSPLPRETNLRDSLSALPRPSRLESTQRSPMLASPESNEHSYKNATIQLATQSSPVYNVSLSGPSAMPNSPVSIALSILYRNYYKNSHPVRGPQSPSLSQEPSLTEKEKSPHFQ